MCVTNKQEMHHTYNYDGYFSSNISNNIDWWFGFWKKS